MPNERDLGWDGGWEKAVEEGEGLAELMMGPAHPYDRGDGYVPDSRWATRHELKSKGFADPADLLDANPTTAAVGRPGPTSKNRKVRRLRTRAVDHPNAATGQAPNSITRSGPPPPFKAPQSAGGAKELRAAFVAEQLGISLPELKVLRRSVAETTAATTGVPEPDRKRLIAEQLAINPKTVERYRQAEATANRIYPTPASNSPPVAAPATRNVVAKQPDAIAHSGPPPPLQAPRSAREAKKLRRAFVAEQLGISESELKVLRRRVAEAVAAANSAPESDRQRLIASRLGMDPGVRERLQDADAAAARGYPSPVSGPPPAAAPKKPRVVPKHPNEIVRFSKPAPAAPTQARRQPKIPKALTPPPYSEVGKKRAPRPSSPRCPSCGRAVPASGRCGCS